MATFARELLAPFLRGEPPSLKRSRREAVDEYWQQFGSTVKTHAEWLSARESFRSQTGNIPVVIRGGGRAGMWTAEKILKSVPNAHVVLYDDDTVLGGMARRAISSFIPGHSPAKPGSIRDAMKLVTNPRIDVVPNTTLSDDAFARMVAIHRLPVAIDAPGAVPARGAYPYGDRVWDIMDMVNHINKPFDEDGHMGRVTVPASLDANGRRLPKVSVIGGNTGRDAQIAFSLVDTVRDIAEKFGIPIEQIDQAEILEHGIARARKELELPALDDLYIYWKSIGEMAGVKKLFQKTAKLKRGDAELAAILENGILGSEGWQEKEGGRFLGNTELESVEDDDQKLRARLRNNIHNSTEDVDASLALISTGFKPGEPFRAENGIRVIGTDVGMKVEGGGDLPSTMISVNAVAPGIISDIQQAGASYERTSYDLWLKELEEAQRGAGTVTPDGTHVDPLAYIISNGPRHMTDKAFIGFKEQDGVDMTSVLRVREDAA